MTTTRHERPTWFEIDLDALVHNYRALRAACGPSVAMYACLKRNAYGCGTVPVARALREAGCEGLAFGNIDDGIVAREGGVDGPILLYPNCLPDSAPVVERHGLTVTVSSVGEAAAWNAAFSARQPVFIKVDAGAFRAGVLPRDAQSLIQAVGRMPRLDLRGAYGHIHLGKVPDRAGYARWQIGNFRRVEEAARSQGVALPLLMLSSSATLLDFPEADFSGVDPGRLLFGLDTPGSKARAVALRPVLQAFKTRLVSARTLDGVDTGGFPPPFELGPGMRTGLLPVGWGDGLPRKLPAGASALVRGRRVPLLGPTHLEQTRIDLSLVPDAQPGDEVVLIGRQQAEELALDDVVALWGTNAAEFQALMGEHLQRRYVHGGA